MPIANLCTVGGLYFPNFIQSVAKIGAKSTIKIGFNDCAHAAGIEKSIKPFVNSDIDDSARILDNDKFTPQKSNNTQ